VGTHDLDERRRPGRNCTPPSRSIRGVAVEVGGVSQCAKRSVRTGSIAADSFRTTTAIDSALQDCHGTLTLALRAGTTTRRHDAKHMNQAAAVGGRPFRPAQAIRGSTIRKRLIAPSLALADRGPVDRHPARSAGADSQSRLRTRLVCFVTS
jgi:hypothetical protein